jgi:hypothetical protein
VRRATRLRLALGLLVATAALALAAVALAGFSQFAGQTTVATGNYPDAIASADLNGDGIPDLVETNLIDSTAGVRLGNGDGTFQEAHTYGVGLYPGALAIGDLNGDGRPDLVVDNHAESDVSVLLGNGDGTFQSAVTYATGIQPYATAIGDFNGDGVPDLATANAGSNNVSVLLGKGDGTFASQQTYAAGGDPNSIAVADLNGDGKQDLVVVNVNDNDVSLLFGNGNGTFQPQVTYPVGASPNNVAVGDFNNDGIPDLAVTDDDVSGIFIGSAAVLLGNGDGTFEPYQDYVDGAQDGSIVAGDFNGDGNQDLALTNLGGGARVLDGNGDGTFQLPQALLTGSGSVYGLATIDLDRDGRPDLLVTNAGDNTAGVLLNTTPDFLTAAFPITAFTPVGSVLIDELRLAGPAGGNDQLVDLYNPSSSPVSVGGWELDAYLGGFSTIPLGTVIPGHGHYLFSGPPGGYYSLGAYAAPNAQLTSGGRTTPAWGGVVLVAPGGATIDKVGFTLVGGTLHAGTGLTWPGTLPSGQFAWVRKFANGVPVNTGDNAADFVFVSTSDNDAAHGSPVLGAPGPGDLTSPTVHNDILQSTLLDPAVAATAYPNRIYTAGSPGTLIVNRSLYNCSGQTPTAGTGCANQPAGTTPMTVTRLRFRITGLTTVDSAGAGASQAVLRADTSTGETGLGGATTCSGTTTVLGIPLDAPSVSGSGGLNSTWTATADLPAGGLAPGQCINVEFTFDVTKTGSFSFSYNAEDDLVRPLLRVKNPLPPGKSVTPKAGCPAVAVRPVAMSDSGTLGRTSTPRPPISRC